MLVPGLGGPTASLLLVCRTSQQEAPLLFGIAFHRRIVPLIIENAHVDDLLRRSWEPIDKLAAAAPLNGEVRI